MRLLATADLHYNHPRSRPLADELIDRMNRAGGDMLLLVGDTASSAGDALERCLERFECRGPKLFVPGNHELWSHEADTYELFVEQLPARVRSMGWQWLQTDPLVAGDLAIVGSVGWYDYSFARADLGIPKRFYEHKISPGAARRFAELAHLFEREDDISDVAGKVIARWNDGRYIRLGRSDEAFLAELLGDLAAQLTAVGRHARHIVAATHHLPFRQILPPPHNAQWDFAKAFLGSERLGELLLQYPNVRHVLCGHSHLAAEAQVGPAQVINIGSGYRWKTYRAVDLPD